MKRRYIALFLVATACSGNLITVTDEAIKDSGTDEETGITTADGTVGIIFSEDGARVSGDVWGIAVVDGNRVTVTNTTERQLIYELSGTSSDGFFRLYSDVKQVISLNGLKLTNPDGAAINNQSHKYTSVVLSGENFLADGSVNSSGDYAGETSDEDMKAAFFSEGQLIFSGDGSLTVTATGKAGITSDDYILVTGTPAISISSASGHGLRGKDKVTVEGGVLEISVAGTGKKGITTDGDYLQNGGSVTIKSSSPAGTVDGELTGAAGIKADGAFTIDGGSLEISVSGIGAKGISCDGEGHFNGGTVKVTATGSNYGNSGGGSHGGPGGWGGWGGGSSSDTNSKAAKGMKFEGDLYFAGSDVTASASSHEAIESKGSISISAGNISATSSDDAINSGSDMTVTGGNIHALSSGNDGLDANGNMYIKGGYVYAVGSGSPELGLDANTEGGYRLYISGGTLMAFGGVESGAGITQAVVNVSSWTAGTSYSLHDGDTLLLEFTAPAKGGNGIVISHPSLVSGSSYTLKSGPTSSTLTASLSAGSSWGGGGQPGRPGWH